MNPFFDKPGERPPEIIQGILREGQIGVLGGTYGIGKSPFVQSLAVSVVAGARWCGRATSCRPVIHVDLENDRFAVHENYRRIVAAKGLAPPDLTEQLDLVVTGGTDAITESDPIRSGMNDRCADFLSARLKQHPNALVIIDPVELFFSLDKVKGPQVLAVYRHLRQVMKTNPQAAFLLTFNLRKRDRKMERPDLLREPRDWLDEVAGSIDIMNRSDVRMGIDLYGDSEDVRVVNGVRRSEDFHPLLIRPVGPPEALAGFERVSPDDLNLLEALTARQRQHWAALPRQFRFEPMADKIVPRASLFRLIDHAKSLGLLDQRGKLYVKVRE